MGYFPESLPDAPWRVMQDNNLGETWLTLHHHLKTVKFMSQGVSFSLIREGECWDDVFGRLAPLPC